MQKLPALWGHRGAMDFAPQNTLPSFLLAQDQGADGVELDVQLTHDGTLVVFHDAVVDALTDGRGPLARLSWTEVKALDAGSHFGPQWKGTRIPSLEAVLAALDPRLTVNVEMKTALSEDPWWLKGLTMVGVRRALPAAKMKAARSESKPLAEAVARLLGSSNADRFVISSFDPLALEAVGPLLPRVPLGFLHSPTVPWDTPTLMQAVDHQAWHPHQSQVNPSSLAKQKAEGRRVNVWTVNDAAMAQKLAGWGVDALITNRPAAIREALNEGTARHQA